MRGVKYVNAALLVAVALCRVLFAQQSAAGGLTVSLQVPAAEPLRLYLTKKAEFHEGEPVTARLVDSVWVFDRVVIPAGTPVFGHITELAPVPKMVRAMSMIRGDFTPLKTATVSFDHFTMVDGHRVVLRTEPSRGLNSIYVPPGPAKPSRKPVSNSKAAQAKSFLKRQAISQANARSRGFLDFVRTRSKKEWLVDFLWSKLPWHPQWYRTGTRFDAVLSQPLAFGEVKIPAVSLQAIGSAPPVDSPAQIRIENTVSSADAKVGDPIQAELSQPIFNAAHQVVLPEGTQLSGRVTLARRARMFHRGGQLRFTFNQVETANLPALAAPEQQRTFAQITAGESASSATKVDEEGTAKATESKTRFLRPVVAGLIAAKSLDNDEGKTAAQGGASANYGGRSLGGFSGFGLFGTAVSFGPRYLGSAFGFYGLAWSVYSTVVSRGREVTFEKNGALAIRFGAVPRDAR